MAAFSWMNQVFNFLAGGQYQTAPTPLTTGSVGSLLIDQYGRLVTVQNAAGSAPSTGLTGGTTQWYDTTSLVANGVVKASAGTLNQLVCSNFGGGTIYLQIFDSPTVPAGATVPKFTFQLTAGQVGSLDLPRGRAFATGISWTTSSTPATYTAVAGTVWVNAEYI